MSYKYCPYCKDELTKNNYEYSCPNNHKVYINPAPCVSIIPIKDNKILLSIRGIEPKKGTIDFIGGFVQVGETMEEAGVRETFEETGLKVELDKFLGEYFEEYIKDITYPHCFLYTAKVIEGNLKAMDDVAKLVWVDIDKIKDLDFSGSFPSIKTVLEKFLEKIKGNSSA